MPIAQGGTVVIGQGVVRAAAKSRGTKFNLRRSTLIITGKYNCRLNIVSPIRVLLKCGCDIPTFVMRGIDSDRQRRRVGHYLVLADRISVSVANSGLGPIL